MPARVVVDPTKPRLIMAPKDGLASMGDRSPMVSFVKVLKLNELDELDAFNS